MYSPYSALLKADYWGGIPVSLFAMGAFTFFAGFSLYLVFAGPRAPRKAVGFFAAVSATPLIVSLAMLVISRPLGRWSVPALARLPVWPVQ